MPRNLWRRLTISCFFRKKKSWTRVIPVVIDHPKCLMSSLISVKTQPFFVSHTKGEAAYSKVKQSRLLSNIKSVIRSKQSCVPRLFRCMRSTGIRNFFRNVSLGNLRLKANCLLDLGRFVGKKTASRWTQLSPGKRMLSWRP